MKILLSVGERSAERYAYFLSLELKKQKQDIELFSFGSDLLSTCTKRVADYKDISVIGFKEAINVLPKAIQILNSVKKAVLDNNIDTVVLLDFPDFNLRLAKFVHKLGKKVAYYITPQVWAWRFSRIKQLNEYADLIIPILPFEKTYFGYQFQKLGFESSKVKYVGHPLVDIFHNIAQNLSKKEKLILILPGSRKKEIAYHAKIFLDVAKLLKNDYPQYSFVVGTPEQFLNYYDELLVAYPFVEVQTDIYNLMSRAEMAITKSGTVTLEAVFFDLPIVVAYRLSFLSYLVGKVLIRGVNCISLPNIIFGGKFVPELIESKANVRNIYKEANVLIQSKAKQNLMREKFRFVKHSLGQYPVIPKIAKEILSLN